MGTSASGSGPNGKTPLVPNWIIGDNSSQDGTGINVADTSNVNQPVVATKDTNSNRYAESRRRFNNYSKNTSSGTGSLKSSLRSYVTRGGGGSSSLAKRMKPSVSRIVQFQNIVNTLKDNGLLEGLKSLSLGEYVEKPLVEVLSALTDFVFNIDNPYSDIQDDSITKMAYVNTINRIADEIEIDLNALTNDNIELMTAIFIEETIATRVLCDIGDKLFSNVEDCSNVIAIEEDIYQIVSGLVRTQIMPEIIATNRGSKVKIEENIEKIYRIAFDCIADLNQ